MTAHENRKELADFLRSRRAQLTPADVGIASIGRRRTPGLRREEVSQLSGVSVTWYTWLEQGRDIKVSSQVVAAVARTLRLDPAEHAHLAALAGHGIEPAISSVAADQAPASLRRLLEAITPNPAYVISASWDVLAWNPAYAALFTGIDEQASADRNLLWMVFTSPSVRRLLVDWEIEARRLLAQFRAEVGHQLAAEPYRSLVERLRVSSVEFDEWWSLHDVAYFTSRRREFDHPSIGRLVLDHHKLALADHPGFRLVVYTPTSEPSSEQGLARLIAAARHD